MKHERNVLRAMGENTVSTHNYNYKTVATNDQRVPQHLHESDVVK